MGEMTDLQQEFIYARKDKTVHGGGLFSKGLFIVDKLFLWGRGFKN
jgi:hypothetical protein